MLAIAAGLSLAASPALAECGVVETGTYNPGTGEFTPDPDGTDYRAVCSANDDGLIDGYPDLPDPLPDGAYVVIDVSGTGRIDANNTPPGNFVIRSTGADSYLQANNSEHRALRVRGDGGGNLMVEARIDMTTTGAGGRGLEVDQSGAGNDVTVVNRGNISTSGGVYTAGDSSYSVEASGIYARSREGSASIENHGEVESTGAGALGIYVRGQNGASMTNSANVTTGGGIATGTYIDENGDEQTYDSVAHAIRVRTDGANADISVDNSGEILTTGAGAIGIQARSRNSGDVSVVNSGSIKTEGQIGTGVTTTDDGPVHWTPHAVFVRAYDGSATLTNNGTIETLGDGVEAIRVTGTTGAVLTNTGQITTRGDKFVVRDDDGNFLYNRTARGLAVRTQSGIASVLNDVDGIIETYGTRAHGVSAESETGDVHAENRGSVILHNDDPPDSGEDASGLSNQTLAVYAISGGNVTVLNTATGTISTAGSRDFALFARADGTTATVTNHGTIETSGYDADAVLAYNRSQENEDANDQVALTVTNTGTVTTHGDGSGAVTAWISAEADGEALGELLVVNSGTITTSGTVPVAKLGSALALDSAHGVRAGFSSTAQAGTSAERLENGGNVTVKNTGGSVNLSGAAASGIYAATWGDGNATVEITNGSINSTYAQDEEETPYDDRGRGVTAIAGANGVATVTVEDGTINAPISALLDGKETLLHLTGGVVTGEVYLGQASGGDDTYNVKNTLRVTNSGRLIGDVYFRVADNSANQPENILEVDAAFGDTASAIDGTVYNVETVNKLGTGDLIVNNVVFLGSTLNVNGGNLVVSGELNLGAAGELIIAVDGNLQVQVGVQNAAKTGIENIGTIIAGTVTYMDGADPSLELLFDPDLSEAERQGALAALAQESVTLINADIQNGTDSNSVTVKDKTGRTVGSVTGRIAGSVLNTAAGVQLADAPRSIQGLPGTGMDGGDGSSGGSGSSSTVSPPASSSGKSSSSSGKGLVVGGGLAMMAFMMFDLFDPMDAEDEKETDAPKTGLAAFAEDTGLHSWGRIAGRNLTGAAEGAKIRLAAPLSGGFRVGLSAMPSAELTGRGSSFEGSRAGLQAGWSDGALFAGLSLSRGDWRGGATFANLGHLDKLDGYVTLQHTHMRATAGGHIEAGGLHVSPSVSLFGGRLDQAAYVAGSAALRAEVPAVSQDYRGWQARLTLAPEAWQGSGALRWKPELSLAAAESATDGPAHLRVHQSDRAGAVRFSTPAAVGALPRRAHALGLGVKAASGEGWRLRAGYLAMAADGRTDHVAVARFNLRF